MVWSTGTSPRSFICPVLCVVHYVHCFCLFSPLNQSLNTWICIGFCWASNSNLNGGRFALLLFPSVCADDPPGEDFSRPCCGEVGLVRVALSPKEKYEWTPLVFECCRIYCPKNLVVVVGACILFFWILFDRWLLTVCHFSSVSIVSLSVSSIFIAVFSLACCPVAFSSVCLTALTIILDLFDPLFENPSFEGSLLNHSLVHSTTREIDLRRYYWIEKHSRKLANKRKRNCTKCAADCISNSENGWKWPFFKGEKFPFNTRKLASVFHHYLLIKILSLSFSKRNRLLNRQEFRSSRLIYIFDIQVSLFFDCFTLTHSQPPTRIEFLWRFRGNI